MNRRSIQKVYAEKTPGVATHWHNLWSWLAGRVERCCNGGCCYGVWTFKNRKTGLAAFDVKKFNVLVLGSRHVYGQGVADGESFVAQLSRRLCREGLSLSVECHAPVSMDSMAALLPRLPLRQYDLIVLQAGHEELLHTTAIGALLSGKPPSPVWCEPTVDGTETGRRPTARGIDWLGYMSTMLDLTLLRAVAAIVGIPRLQQTRRALRTILDSLQPYGHNVVLLTPFPHQDAVSGWLRKQGRAMFLEEGSRAFMPVFDAHALLNMGDVCFLTDNSARLNAVGHEVLGSALYDFYRIGTTVVDDFSSFRRYR